MGLFDKIFGPRKKKEDEALANMRGYFKTLTAYQPVFSSWDGAIYESDLVRTAVETRAAHISKLKVEISGSAHPILQTRLRLQPNKYMTWSQFLARCSRILDIDNTLFIVPQFDDQLNVIGYFPVVPSNAAVVDYKGEPWLRFKFWNGDTGAVEWERVGVMTKHQYKNDFFGEDNGALDKTMELIQIQNQGIEEAAKNSATYRFMAQLNNFSKSTALAEERKRFDENNFSANAEGGGLLLFPNTYSNIKQIESTQYKVDADQMEYIRTNVYNYFGVSADVLQNKVTGDSWNAFYEGAVEPFAIQFSEVMTKCIFTERERANGNYVMATANRLQYMSNTDKLNVSSQLTDRGVMTTNEAREIFNLPPVEGGDVRTIRGEYKNADEQVGGSSDASDN